MAAYDTSAWSCCHGGSVASVLGVFSLLQSPPFAVCHRSCRFRPIPFRLIPFPRIARVAQTHGCGDAYPFVMVLWRLLWRLVLAPSWCIH